jgi:hypothetical protein
VVVLVPIALGVPAVLVFIPPTMPFTPAMLSCAMQLATLVICLSAVASMLLNCLVEFMVRVSDAALTPVDVFRVKSRRCAEEKDCAQDRT